MPEPKHDDVTFHEETDSSTYADDRKFYKVEKWTRDAVRWRVVSLIRGRCLMARSNTDRARACWTSGCSGIPQLAGRDRKEGPPRGHLSFLTGEDYFLACYRAANSTPT